MSCVTAVIDRIVDGAHAVLLIGEEEVERVVPVASLPTGSKAGSWLTLSFREGDVADGHIEGIALNDDAANAARERIQAKMEKLRRRARPEER